MVTSHHVCKLRTLLAATIVASPLANFGGKREAMSYEKKDIGSLKV